jgi:hypothetical protein
MSEIDQNQFIASIAHDVVAQIAPQELPLFPALSEAYFKNPHQMHKGQEGKDELLGFGMETVSAVLMSPFVLAIVNDVVQALTQEVTDSGAVRKLLEKLHILKKSPGKVITPFSLAQMEQVHQTALLKAQQFKLSDTQAELLADALVGRLVLANQHA